MNILSTIRNRAGMFVLIIVGLALLAFVAEGLLNRMGYGHGQSGPQTVAEINGVSISSDEYNQVYNQYLASKNGDFASSKAHEDSWRELLDKYIYGAEYEKLGITVTDKELASMLYSDQAEPYIRGIFSDDQGRLNQQFATTDGRLNMNTVRDFVKSIKPNTEYDRLWANVEKSVRRSVMRQKYNNLIRKGMYVTRAEARRRYNEENTLYTFRYVYKPFGDIVDSTIPVKEDELKKYYDEHQYMFPQDNETRDIEYVTFKVDPTDADAKLISDNFKKVGEAWVRAKTFTEDTTFLRNQWENPMNAVLQYTDLIPGRFPAGTDSLFLKAPDNSMLEPMRDKENLRMYKVVKQLTLNDSARVRHILINIASQQNPAGRPKDVAKKFADSLANVIRNNRSSWNDLCVKFSGDPGSSQPDKDGKNKYGDYGWLNLQTGTGASFVKPYMDFALTAKVGDVSVVETQFGYHIMEKLEQSKGSYRAVRTLYLDRSIVPSQATYNAVNAEATDFANKNNTAELFDKAVKNEKKPMQLEVAKDKKAFDYGYTTFTNGKQLTQWMYKQENKVGTISEPIHIERLYIVAKLTKIIPVGTKPLTEESVRKICEVEVRKEKKAEMIMTEFSKAGSTLDAAAAALKKPVLTAANVNFASADISGVGAEATVVGRVSVMSKGATSKPIKGELGVFMVQLDNVTLPTQPLKDEATKQRTMSNEIGGSALGPMDKVLTEKANIKDDRSWAIPY